MRNKAVYEEKSCKLCGVKFYRSPRRDFKKFSKRLYCSHSCSSKDRKVLTRRTCLFCSAEFVPERSDRKFCNSKCVGGFKALHGVTPARYKKITTPDGRRMLEHRYVMESKIGRRLEAFEQVHHKNGNKKENHEDNLELWVKAQPGGQRVDDLIEFVVSHYPDRVKSELLRRITHA